MVTLSEAFTPAETPVSEMSDRALLEESVDSQRKFMAVLGGLMQAAAMHPQIRMMLVANGIMP